MQYGIVGWGGASKSNLEPLRVMQRAILKVILKKPKYYSTSLLFSTINVLDIRQIYIKVILIYVFKHFNNFERREISRNNTRYVDEFSLRVPKRSKTKGQQHLDFIAPRIFNHLPFHTRSCRYLSKFKNEIFNWLIYSEPIYLKELLYPQQEIHCP